MRVLELTKGFVAIVDDDVFLEVGQYNWCFDGAYAVRRKRGPDGISRKVYLHHEIMGPVPKGFQIDHRNRLKLDCRRENLRVGTPQQNLCNNGIQKSNKSGYRGVHWSKGQKKWVVQISSHGKMSTVGSFHVLEDAAAAYNQAALQKHGEFATLNAVANLN